MPATSSALASAAVSPATRSSAAARSAVEPRLAPRVDDRRRAARDLGRRPLGLVAPRDEVGQLGVESGLALGEALLAALDLLAQRGASSARAAATSASTWVRRSSARRTSSAASAAHLLGGDEGLRRPGRGCARPRPARRGVPPPPARRSREPDGSARSRPRPRPPCLGCARAPPPATGCAWPARPAPRPRPRARGRGRRADPGRVALPAPPRIARDARAPVAGPCEHGPVSVKRPSGAGSGAQSFVGVGLAARRTSG